MSGIPCSITLLDLRQLMRHLQTVAPKIMICFVSCNGLALGMVCWAASAEREKASMDGGRAPEKTSFKCQAPADRGQFDAANAAGRGISGWHRSDRQQAIYHFPMASDWAATLRLRHPTGPYMTVSANICGQ